MYYMQMLPVGNLTLSLTLPKFCLFCTLESKHSGNQVHGPFGKLSTNNIKYNNAKSMLQA